VGAVAAWYKYGDRTELAKKSLDGTNETLYGLCAYLGGALADSVKPTVRQIIENSTQLDGTLNIPPEAILEELRSENFQNDISSFVTRDLDEMVRYRMLIDARDRWSKWARWNSWGVLLLIAIESLFTIWFGLANRVFSHPVSLPLTIASFSLSGVVFAFCILCAGVMLRCHDKISAYRDKVL